MAAYSGYTLPFLSNPIAGRVNCVPLRESTVSAVANPLLG